MAKTAVYQLRIEPQLKQQAITLSAELGISLGDALNLFVRQYVAYQGLPFEVRKFREPSDNVSLSALQELKDMQNGDISKQVCTLDDMDNWLTEDN